MTPFCVLANTHPADKPGEHWVGLLCNTQGDGYYFDSFGRPPQKEFVTFLKKYCKTYDYGHQRIQGVLSSCCGLYCAYVMLMWARGYTPIEIVNRFSKEDRVGNDIVVTKFINTVYDTSFPVYHTDFVVDQISTALGEV